MIKKIPFVCFGVLFLNACAEPQPVSSNWQKDSELSERDKAHYECQQQAMAATSNMSFGASLARTPYLYKNCMLSKGYSQKN